MSGDLDYMPTKRKSPSRTIDDDDYDRDDDDYDRDDAKYCDVSSKVHSIQYVNVASSDISGYGVFDPTPTRGSSGAAAFDLKSRECHILCPKETAKIPVGICMEIPDGLYAEIKGRSGLAAKAIMCHNGVIDSDYRGEVCVILYNASEETFDIKRGDRVAQMVFHRVEYVKFQRVKKLTETQRGEGGFGSTGM